MAIARNPQKQPTDVAEKKAENFISGAGAKGPKGPKPALIPIQVKFQPALLEKATEAAPTLGLNRSAFIVLAVAEKLIQMGR